MPPRCALTRTLVLLPAAVLCMQLAAATTFDVTKFGAKGDGVHLDTVAIAQAFAACRTAHGGEVLFPAPGRYLTGPWQVSCNDSVVTVQAGATVLSTSAGDKGSTKGWPVGPLPSPEPSQGATSAMAAPFVLLHYARNVTLRGGGTLDAGGAPFWNEHCGNWWCPAGGHSSSGKGALAWRPFMLRIDHSEGVSVEGLHFVDCAFWCIVPVHSRDVSVAHSTITAHGPNTDGIEPMWSSGVHVHHVNISNGDDCITVKSGSSDVLVEDVRCEESHGLTVGSVWFDDVSNVTYRRCHLSKTKAGPRIKGRSQGNATVRNITFEDITLEGVGVGLEVDMNYETPGSTAKSIGCTAVGVAFRNISGSVTEKAADFACSAGRPCADFQLDAVSLVGASSFKCEHVRLQLGADGVKPKPGAGCLN